MKQNYKKSLIAIITVFIFSSSAFAQEVLTAQDAVRIALENNYSIKIAANQKEISSNNATLGNAGALPSLDASASYNRSSNNTKQNYSNGTVVDQTGAISKNYAAGVNLSWTIFDGLKMFASLYQLKELKKTGEINYKKEVEQNISDVLSSFYDIVRQELLLEVINKNISISEERLKIVNNEKEVGAASKFDLLKAKVDLNTDKSSLLNQQELLLEAKVKLNRLLGRDINTKFEIEKEINISQDLSYDDLKPVAEENNSDLSLALQNKNISELQLNLERSELLPKINLSLGYNYSKSESGAGFFISSKTTAFSYGASFSLNLFNGLNTRRKIENAQVAIENSELQYKQTYDKFSADLLNAFQKYENSLELVKLEAENYKSAEENSNLALERLRVGSITPIDFRESQKDLLAAKSRLVSAQYNAKNSETELLKISGQLVKSAK